VTSARLTWALSSTMVWPISSYAVEGSFAHNCSDSMRATTRTGQSLTCDKPMGAVIAMRMYRAVGLAD
jgi:hypothetical protein